MRGEETLNKYKKQGAAYALAFEEVYRKRIDEVQVWISHPEGLQIETLVGDEMEKKKKEFIELSKDFHAQWDVKPYEDYYHSQKMTENESKSNT